MEIVIIKMCLLTMKQRLKMVKLQIEYVILPVMVIKILGRNIVSI